MAFQHRDPRLIPVRHAPEVVVSPCSSSREDVLLWRVLRDTHNGCYVDIGAGDPNHGSVTRWFYLNGWTGVNVEPHPFLFPILDMWRPKDINLNCGVAQTAGAQTFHKVEVDAMGHGWGLSSFDPAAAAEAARLGHTVTRLSVPTRTLAQIAEEHCCGREIDLLKIDVEGYEKSVVLSADWTRFRPRVLCIEATLPLTNIPSFAEWEPTLIEAGYIYVMFDGANNFYVRRESEELLSQFNCGLVNADRWRPAEQRDFKEPWLHADWAVLG